MTQWWEIDTRGFPDAETKFRTIAYYRHESPMETSFSR